MTAQTPIAARNNDNQRNEPDPWSMVTNALLAKFPPAPEKSSAGSVVLGTVRADGKPHAAQVGAMWFENAWVIVTGGESQKGRNLQNNPTCTIATSLDGFDVVFTGVSERVTDVAHLERIAAYYSHNGWPAVVEGEGFNAPFFAPGGGPPPWNVYQIRLQEVVSVGGSGGSTSWTFAE